MCDHSRLSVGAIVKAVLLAILAEVLLVLASSLIVVALVLFRVLTAAEIDDSAIIQAVFFSIAVAPGLLGGYLAANFAGRNALLHGFVTGVVLAAVGGLLHLIPDEKPFALKDGIELVLTVVFAVAGAAIGRPRE